MVYFPHAVQGKAWKFAHPNYGPYKVLALTSSNAEVCLIDGPEDQTIFVALDRVRPCYSEMTNDVWAGHGYRGSSRKKMKKKLPQSQDTDARTEAPLIRVYWTNNKIHGDR